MLSEEEYRELREAYRLIHNFIIHENKRRYKSLCRRIEQHPEAFPKDFLTEYYADKEHEKTTRKD